MAAMALMASVAAVTSVGRSWLEYTGLELELELDLEYVHSTAGTEMAKVAVDGQVAGELKHTLAVEQGNFDSVGTVEERKEMQVPEVELREVLIRVVRTTDSPRGLHLSAQGACLYGR